MKEESVLEKLLRPVKKAKTQKIVE